MPPRLPASPRRNVTLAPVSLGLDLPAFYQPLLEPYTRHKVRHQATLPLTTVVLLGPGALRGGQAHAAPCQAGAESPCG